MNIKYLFIISCVMLCFASGAYGANFKETLNLAQSGDMMAQFKVASMYMTGVIDDGNYGASDFKNAEYWYLKAAAQGDPSIQYKVGIFYANQRDFKNAVKWYRVSAMQGYADAQSELSVMYYHGESVPKDYKLYYAWLYLAESKLPVSLFLDDAAKLLTEKELIEAKAMAAEIQSEIDKNRQ